MNSKETLIAIAEKLTEITPFGEKDYNGICENVESALKSILAAMFPLHVNPTGKSILENLKLANRFLILALSKVSYNEENTQKTITALMSELPKIRRILWTDIIAAYRGDPAAKSFDEIILTYPAFRAISAYRIAHEFYTLKIPLIPRIITEYAHRLTGIDIHPGASIGEYFFYRSWNRSGYRRNCNDRSSCKNISKCYNWGQKF